MGQIEQLFHAVPDGSAEERVALLARADPELRREVGLLFARQSEDLLLDRPAIKASTQFNGGSLFIAVLLLRESASLHYSLRLREVSPFVGD